MPHRLRLEGDRQRAAILPMLFEIEQHQPAREQLVEQRAPALVAGENLVAVEQDQFVRFRAGQHNPVAAKGAIAIDLAVFRHHRAGEGVRIGEDAEGVAHDRETAFAGYVRDGIEGKTLAPVIEARAIR